MHTFWIKNICMFTPPFPKWLLHTFSSGSSYNRPCHLLHFHHQPTLIWWHYLIIHWEIKNKQQESLFFPSPKQLTLSISALFPVYHIALWIKNPHSCQRPDIPTKPIVFLILSSGFHFYNFLFFPLLHQCPRSSPAPHTTMFQYVLSSENSTLIPDSPHPPMKLTKSCL